MKPRKHEDLTDIEKLRKVRKLKKLSQEQFADPLDLSQGTYSDYERGRTPLPVRFLEEVFSCYNINPDWWERGIGPVFIVEEKEKTVKSVIHEKTSIEIELLQIEAEQHKAEATFLRQKMSLLERQLKDLQEKNKTFKINKTG